MRNLEIGKEIPQLVKTPTLRTLVQYAGASGDFYEIHYDDAFARALGLPGVIVHGMLKGAYLAQLVTDWLRLDGRLISLAISYRGIDQPGHPLRCRGVVKRIDARTVELEIWIENPQGVTTTTGSAVVEFE